ncbi:MAG TPA: CbrC family protein [Candidatus Ignatzschineria merdigallinarum]|uniref:CbrC family protein n=1 Tax=Candidatus Ignatzschineria merdigallinarum TaxID=2838621 RepID=A0A9D1TT64_9GAMM|nr:CbrC family protein [Candidatus Ignatzschineria merdigallinarum]
MNYPYFKYHPNAYLLDLFVEKEGICSICNEARSLKYEASFYSVEKPDYICPFCIADGGAAQKYDGEFNDYCGIEGVSADPNDPSPTIPQEMLLDICKRTPSYISWQQEAWLTHCNEPCAFIDYANRETIAPFREEVISELDSSLSEEVLEYISKDGDCVGYLFQCVQCGKHKLHVDFS